MRLARSGFSSRIGLGLLLFYDHSVHWVKRVIPQIFRLIPKLKYYYQL